MTLDLPQKIRQYVREELQGVYVISIVMVEKVDNESRRCEVSLKRDKDVLVDNVPIATPLADSDSNGEITPVQAEDEGLLFHSKAPNDKLIVEKGHEEVEYKQRQYSPRDGFFMPMFWNDNDDTSVKYVNDRSSPKTDFSMPYEEGEYLLVNAESMIRIKPNGNVIIADKNDQLIKMDAENNKTIIQHPTNKQKVELNDTMLRSDVDGSAPGFLVDAISGAFKMFDKGGYGIESDGSGNVQIHASSFDVNSTSGSL